MWIKLDDRIVRHPKFVQAGPIAAWLWVGGMCYCGNGLTDGFIPRAALHGLAAIPKPERYAALLVSSGLWETTEGGWLVHDYHDYQPTREWAEKRQEQRREAGRIGGRRSGDKRSETPSENEASRLASRLATRQVSTQANGQVVTQAKTNPVPVPVIRTHTPRARGPLIESPLAYHKAHREHAFCGGRLCVPSFLHHEFERNLGGVPEDHTVWLQGVYAAADAELQTTGRPVDDALKFVRGVFAERVKKLRRPDPAAHIPEWFECATCGGAHQGKAGDPCPKGAA